MSPKEYLEKSAEGNIRYGGGGYDALIKKLTSPIHMERILQYKEMTLGGSKMPMPVLEYCGKKFSQEGNHRAYVAMLLGVEEIPVMVVSDAKRKAWEVSAEEAGMDSYKHEQIVRGAISKGNDVPAEIKALYGLN